MPRVLIVGAGFSGAVLARELADKGGIQSLVIDSRDHLAGNCHTERDGDTGIMLHRYGPHIFHTSNESVWQYVNQFAVFHSFVNRVKASVNGCIYPIPINLHTINQFFGLRLGPAEAREFIESKSDRSIQTPANFEEQALKTIGRELYEAFIKSYTFKQWGCDPKELPASVFKRLPIRFDYNDSYYNSRYQGIPEGGYTSLIEQILDRPGIEVKLGVGFDNSMIPEFSHVFYTGPIDSFYRHSAGHLSYRTVFWERSCHEGDFQGNAVINYPGSDVPHTRVHEHKHFMPWEPHRQSIVFTEYSKETGEGDAPYYPKRLHGDLERFKCYQARAYDETRVSFLGRLATYRYLDMHQVIAESLQIASEWLAAHTAKRALPNFPQITHDTTNNGRKNAI